MTKKAAKKKPAEKKRALTDEQIDQLASTLHGQCYNVYNLCERMFCVTVGEEVFDWVAKAKGGGVFKCEECNEWKTIDWRSSEDSDFCAGCLDDLDRDDEFEDEGDE